VTSSGVVANLSPVGRAPSARSLPLLLAHAAAVAATAVTTSVVGRVLGGGALPAAIVLTPFALVTGVLVLGLSLIMCFGRPWKRSLTAVVARRAAVRR